MKKAVLIGFCFLFSISVLQKGKESNRFVKRYNPEIKLRS